MPHGRVGGDPGAGVSTPSPGTFSATASTSGSTAFGLTKSGFLTELSIRIDGDPMASTISGGPVIIEAWLARGSFYRQLCYGGIQNELTVKGSGMLPVSAGDRIVVKWSELSGTGVTVRVDTYVDEATPGENPSGWFDESPKLALYWTFRQVCTQDNAGGGNLCCTVLPASGSVMQIVELQWTASGSRAIIGTYRDTDNADHAVLFNQTATAGANASLPSPGSTPNTTGNAMGSQGLAFVNPNLVLLQVTAAAQTETATIESVWLITGILAKPTAAWTASGGTPNAAAASEDRMSLVRL